MTIQMKKKYHIAKDGTARTCTAQNQCPLGGSEIHGAFSTPQEAQLWAEETLTSEHGLGKSYRKAKDLAIIRKNKRVYEEQDARETKVYREMQPDWDSGKSVASEEMIAKSIEYYEAQAESTRAALEVNSRVNLLARLRGERKIKGYFTWGQAAGANAHAKDLKKAMEIRKDIDKLDPTNRKYAEERLLKLVGSGGRNQRYVDNTLADQHFEKIDSLSRQFHSNYAEAQGGEPEYVKDFSKTSKSHKKEKIDLVNTPYDDLYFAHKKKHFFNARASLNAVLENEKEGKVDLSGAALHLHKHMVNSGQVPDQDFSDLNERTQNNIVSMVSQARAMLKS